jgi:CheY-like chemotaxis protein
MPDWLIDTTTSGYEALIRLGAKAPDLLILDVCMPGTDSYKILEAVRSNEQTAAVKVLVVSGYVEKLDDMIAKGADASLEKPFMPEDLLTATKKILSHRYKRPSPMRVQAER